MRVSIVLPIYNEAKNLKELFVRLFDVISREKYTAEVIAVNDGSHDDSWNVLKSIAQIEPRLRLINFNHNYGQTASLYAGISHAHGDVLVLMDADLENDPSDISHLVNKINDGYDIVSGWRQNRWPDRRFTRRWPSKMANKLISLVSGVKLSDHGCTLKAYRRHLFNDLPLYGDMHRSLPAYIAIKHRVNIAEVPVSFTPRKHGASNYGLNRIWKVILDLFSLKFFSDYASRPIHLFGFFGLSMIGIGTISGFLAAYFKLSTAHHKDFISTPLPVLMAMFMIVGFQLILMGLLAELLIRIYYESRNKTPYVIKEKLNL